MKSSLSPKAEEKSSRLKEEWSVGVREYWSIGVLEYWSIGVLVYWCIGVLVYWFLSACITPLFHHSTTPVPGFAALQYVIRSHTLRLTIYSLAFLAILISANAVRNDEALATSRI
jgi:hypothetical protein